MHTHAHAQQYRRTSREIKRLEATYRSPIYAHFTESLHGVACLRAFKLVRRFEDASHERIDALNRVFWPMISCNRWLGLRLELCGEMSSPPLFSHSLATEGGSLAGG